MTAINPDKLAGLDTDDPGCASKIIRGYTISLNDRWSEEKRQQLKPYLARMIDTSSDDKENMRREILRREVATVVSPWLRLAGLSETADRLDATKTIDELRSMLDECSSRAWDKRVAQRRKLAGHIEDELKKRELPVANIGASASATVIAVADAAAAAESAVAAVAVAASADALAAITVDITVGDIVAAATTTVAITVDDAIADAVANAVACSVGRWANHRRDQRLLVLLRRRQGGRSRMGRIAAHSSHPDKGNGR